MKQRLITGLAMAFVVVVMFLTKIIIETPIIFDIFLLLIAVVGAYEFSKILAKTERNNHMYLIVAFPVLAFTLLFLSITLGWSAVICVVSLLGLVFALTLASVLITIFSIAKTENEMRLYKVRTSRLSYAFQKAMNGVLGYVYPSVLLLLLMPINHMADLQNVFGTLTNPNLASVVFLAICFLIPAVCDTFAYFTGGIIGGKKLAPTISPKKTISGAVGGVVWTALLMVVIFLVFNSIPEFAALFMELGLAWWGVALLAIVGAVACIVGDLFESWMKRKADVKDSGEIFPGHGGMLDRIDGFLFVAPIILILLFIL